MAIETIDQVRRGLPEGWRMITFGEVARNVDVQERDPLSNGIDRYLGLEHIEPGNLHIKGWGNVADGTTFTRRFRPGQVLFGKRRAYQRKAAVAEFDGICSGDILVFEAKTDELIPELLPFIVESDGFFEHALRTSAGSLSPRTKWKELADYAFPLPPKPEQKRIAEVLWAADAAVERWRDVTDQIKTVFEASLSKLTSPDEKAASALAWEETAVGSILESCEYGLSNKSDSEGNVPIVGMANLINGIVLVESSSFVTLSPREVDAYRLRPGDILFNRTNSLDLVGKVGIVRAQPPKPHVFASYLVRLRVNQAKVLPAYLNYFLNSSLGQQRIRAYATPGVSQANINASNLKKVTISLPDLATQRAAVELLEYLMAGIDRAAGFLETHSRVRRALSVQLLERGLGDI